MEIWTIARVLEWSTSHLREKGFETPRLDAQLLLAESLNLDKIKLYLLYDKPLNAKELATFKANLKRRLDGEPVAYIIGRKDFWKFSLKIDNRVLIPRPETEILVESALSKIDQNKEVKIADICSGSGAIVLAIASERPNAQVIATDISENALEIARINASELNLDIQFIAGNLFEPLTGQKFDMILSNPPYVTEQEYENLSSRVKDYEPKNALIAGVDGLNVIKLLIDQAPLYLVKNGWLLFEIGKDQGQECFNLMEEHFTDISITKDLAGHDRVVAGRIRQEIHWIK